MRLLIFKFYLLIFPLIFAQDSCTKLIETANQELKSQGSQESKKKLLLEVTTKCPKAPEAFYNLAVIFFQESNYVKALEYVSKALEEQTNDKFFVLALASALKISNRAQFESIFKKASVQAKKELLQRVQNSSEVNFILDFLEPQLACDFIRLAFKFSFNDFVLNNYQLCRDQPLASFYEIIVKYLRGNEITPSDVEQITLYDLGLLKEHELVKILEIFSRASLFQEAELIFRRLKKSNNLTPDYSCLGAYVLANRKKIAEAKEYYLGPLCKSWECFDLCARAAYISGDFNSARTIIEDGLKIHPDSPYLYNSLGVIHRSLGNRREAREMFKKALDLKPDFKEAQHNLDLN